jgi:hypothetical protein
MFTSSAHTREIASPVLPARPELADWHAEDCAVLRRMI